MVLCHRTLHLGPTARADLSLASYHFVLDLSPKTDLSPLVKPTQHLTHKYFESLTKVPQLSNDSYICEIAMIINIDKYKTM